MKRLCCVHLLLIINMYKNTMLSFEKKSFVKTKIQPSYFPNFSQNVANFPNSKGTGPIPKNGCESPETLAQFTNWCLPNFHQYYSGRVSSHAH